MGTKKSSSPQTHTISGRKAHRELRRARALARRGPLAAYRFAASLGAGVLVAGPAMLQNAQSGMELDSDVFRFALAFVLIWILWGVIDSVFADVQHRQEREADLARRVADRQRKREMFDAAAQDHGASTVGGTSPAAHLRNIDI